MNRFVLLTLLFSALLLVSVSCGGGAGITQLGDAKDVQGISQAGFSLVRYDDQGNATNALNPTLDLAVQPAADTTTVRIAIDDKQPALGVTCDLHYDPTKYTPADVQFEGLIDTDVELAVTRLSGLVAVGQVSTHGAAARTGQFATVTFRNEPNRTISAAGDAADKPIDSAYSAGGFTAEGFTATANAGAVDVNILGIFTSLSGDGDQNGSSNIGDLTPLGAMLGKAVSATDAVSARADYDGNGLPNISDLTPLGANLGEVTTGIELLAGDSNDVDGMNVVHTFDWVADGDAPVSPATVTADPSDVWRQFQFSLDAATADGIDADNDGHIFLSARAVTTGGGVNGVGFDPPVDIDLGNAVVSNFVVTSLHLQLAGQDVTDGATLALQNANDHITLEVSSFDGTFNGVPFNHQTDLDTPTHPTSADYQDELAKIQEDLQLKNQTLSTAPGFETDKAGVLLNFAHHGTGSAPAQPATADVFPDDDPGNTAEGTATFGFTRSNNTVADMTVTLDVQPDPVAPLVDSLNGGGGQDGNGNWVVTSTTPDIKGHLTFPGGDPGTLDDTTIDVELVDLTHKTRLPIDFNYTPAPPTLGGTFTLAPSAGPGYDFTIRVPAGAFNSSSLYAVRFFAPAGEHGSSVNQPGVFFTGGTVPSGFQSQVLPRHDVDSTEDTIAILPSDPQILRNPQQDANIPGGTVTNHYGGSSDVLKSDGDFFSLEFSGGVEYPQVVIMPGTDPGVIQATDTPDLETNPALQSETNPHRIVLDISAINVNDGTTGSYAYKVFGAPVIPGDLSSRPVVTSGTFQHHASGDPVFVSNISGVDFGVNIFDSNPPTSTGDLSLNQADFSRKVIHTASLPLNWGDSGNDVDVLFVQFNGGHVEPDSFSGAPGNQREGFTPNSVQVVLKEITGAGPQVIKPLDVRVAGIGNGGLDYIGLAHYIATEDVGPGGLVSTLDYEVQLKDGFAGSTFSFGTQPTDPHITVL